MKRYASEPSGAGVLQTLHLCTLIISFMYLSSGIYQGNLVLSFNNASFSCFNAFSSPCSLPLSNINSSCSLSFSCLNWAHLSLKTERISGKAHIIQYWSRILVLRFTLSILAFKLVALAFFVAKFCDNSLYRSLVS